MLTTFCEEFIALTPGEGNFPAEFTIGDNTGRRQAVRQNVSRPTATVRYMSIRSLGVVEGIVDHESSCCQATE